MRMRVGQIGEMALPPAHPGADAAQEGSRALVPLKPAAAPREVLVGRRLSPFLAQLLATKDGHPQSRARRRATPDEAMAAYRNAAALTRS
jgi:hypothetical protein